MKWAIREAVDVYFKAKSALKLGARTLRPGEPILIFDTVQTSTLEVAAEISYVTGGRGNVRILSFEGDKTLTFNFEDALLSNEGLAILAGADLIPARNARLPGSSPDAKSVIAHFTEKYAVVGTNNIADGDPTNQFAYDESLVGLDRSPRGGPLNVWLSKKPYTGQNGGIYVMLLDGAGEMSGAPVEIKLDNPSRSRGNEGDPGYLSPEDVNRRSHLAKWAPGDFFIAVDTAGNPMSRTLFNHPMTPSAAAVFDDQVGHYVDVESAARNWVEAWGDIRDYIRYISAAGFGDRWGELSAPGESIPDNVQGHDGSIVFRYVDGTRQPIVTVDEMAHDTGGGYGYLLEPSGGVGQPKAFREGGAYVYKVNVPSILFQDIVLIDYYVEHRRGATQVTILPDKFGPFVYVEGSTLVRRASDGVDLPATFVIPKFKITTQLTFTMASTGDASTFNFEGDAYPDFSKFDMTRRVLADVQIIDETLTEVPSDPTDYRRFNYTNADGDYLWKDPSLQPHSNIDYADTGTYQATEGGPATRTPGDGQISRVPHFESEGNRVNVPRGHDILRNTDTGGNTPRGIENPLGNQPITIRVAANAGGEEAARRLLTARLVPGAASLEQEGREYRIDWESPNASVEVDQIGGPLGLTAWVTGISETSIRGITATLVDITNGGHVVVGTPAFFMVAVAEPRAAGIGTAQTNVTMGADQNSLEVELLLNPIGSELIPSTSQAVGANRPAQAIQWSYVRGENIIDIGGLSAGGTTTVPRVTINRDSNGGAAGGIAEIRALLGTLDGSTFVEDNASAVNINITVVPSPTTNSNTSGVSAFSSQASWLSADADES